VSYPYLLATLPALRFREAPPLTFEAFLDLCATALGSEAAEILGQLLEGSTESFGTPALEDYQGYKRSLDHQIVQIRARSLGREVVLSTDLMPEAPLPQAEEVMHAHNPYEAELLRIRLLWDRLKQLSSGQFLNFTLVALYALKLELSHRKAKFDLAKGQERLMALAKGLLPERFVSHSAGVAP